MRERPDRDYGSETGDLPQRCIECGRWFQSPTGFGIYCRDCRVDVINNLPLRRSAYQAVYLDCVASPSCGLWVRHTFHGIQDVIVSEKTSFQIWYKCAGCGAMRMFGLQDRR
jgi:DNA-directed RNA polymerase subunit RPC12/RpoP